MDMKSYLFIYLLFIILNFFLLKKKFGMVFFDFFNVFFFSSRLGNWWAMEHLTYG
jgi:hypothetical protein